MKIAEMAEKVEGLLLYKAAHNSGRGIDRLESSIAKHYANEVGKEVTELSSQIYGTYGYSKDFPR